MKGATVGPPPSLMPTNCFGSAGYPDASETRHLTRESNLCLSSPESLLIEFQS